MENAAGRTKIVNILVIYANSCEIWGSLSSINFYQNRYPKLHSSRPVISITSTEADVSDLSFFEVISKRESFNLFIVRHPFYGLCIAR